MKTLSSFFVLMLLVGCAGVRVEVTGFSPQFTQRVMSAAYESQKRFCTDGIAAERRDAVVESHTPSRGMPYEGPRARSKGEFRCN